MAAEKINVFKQISVQIKGITEESLEMYSPYERKNSGSVTIDLGGNITEWSLRVFPNGDNVKNKSNIGFFLFFEDFDSSNFSVKYQLGLVGKTEKGNYVKEFIEKSGNEIKELEDNHFGYRHFGYSEFISHEELFNERSDLIVNGTLTFFCDLALSTLDNTLNENKASLNQTVVDDFKRMLDDELFTDFELKTDDGETIKAHKAILAARSHVFLGMLTADMKEVRENCVKISDFDSVIMKEVLRYIYCSEVQGLDEIVHKLIYAADKYQLDGLKKICIDRISSLLSTQNVLESLVIADRFDNMKLFDECINFIGAFKLFDKLSDTEEWKDFPPALLTKIISTLSKQNEKEFSTQMKTIDL